MKKGLKFLGLVLIVFVLGSCHARVTDTNTTRYENGVQYFQDSQTHAVFAIVVIKTGINLQEDGVGLAYIPKSDITPEIESKIKNYQR